MACAPCEKAKKARQAAWKTYNLKEPSKQIRWHIVCVSAGKSPLAVSLLGSLRKLAKAEDIEVTLVDTSCPAGVWIKPCDVRDLYNASYVGMPAETNIPRAFNTGASRLRSSKYTLLIHDDVQLPRGEKWLCALEKALDRSAGLVVPHLTGSCPNPIQSLDEYGAIIHSTEYVSSAALAFHTRELIGEGLNEKLSGQDWWNVDWQVRMAMRGRATLVAPVTMHHEGNQTYAGVDRDAFLANLRTMNESFGWPLDFKARPRFSRAHLHRDDMQTGKALVAIVAHPSEVAKAWKMFEEEKLSQICILDTMQGKEIETACDKFDRSKIYYVPQYEDDPFQQAVSIPDYRKVKIVDFRAGADLHTVEGTRIRAGLRYVLPQQVSQLHIGMLQHYGLGDTLYMTSSIHEFKRQFPHVKITVHHAWQAGELLLNNPNIDEVLAYQQDKFTPPAECVDMMPGNGSEDSIWSGYRELGLEVPEKPELHYHPTDQERQQAKDWLKERGVDVTKDEWVVGTQKLGGWKVKRWGNFEECVKSLQEKGAKVLVFGKSAEDEIPGTILVANESLRLVFALIAIIDGLISFDSGLGYGAMALGTSWVSLWCAHDPKLLIGNVGHNYVAIRKRTPQMCQEERGNHCRALTGGSSCPFREDGAGSDGYDAISAEEAISELESLPRWNIPVQER